MVFTTPIIRAVRRRFPTARLLYLVEQLAAPVVETNPHLSSVITVPHSRGWRRVRDDLRIARRLRAERVDLAIDLHGGPRSAWLTWATRARMRVGYDVPGRSWMYTHVVHRPRTYQPRHAVANQWDLLAAVDPQLATPPLRALDRVEMPVDGAVAVDAVRALAARGIDRTTRLIVLHVSAGNPFRRWPEESFAAVAARLAQGDPQRAVLITAGPSDRDAAARVIASARQQAGAAAARIVDADHLSLAALRATLEHAALFIGGDSGPLHVAATSDVPIVAIYGPTLPERSEPWRPGTIPTAAVDAGALPCRPCDQRVCEPGDFRCLSNVSASAVITAATAMLEATR